ncbi:hypothetical protein HanOQP8_Chr02g0040741 [Helianthus annuus]|nr:hypothetical protein HanOQP8_Chr02g0040741 [Helianthus annuus]
MSGNEFPVNIQQKEQQCSLSNICLSEDQVFSVWVAHIHRINSHALETIKSHGQGKLILLLTKINVLCSKFLLFVTCLNILYVIDAKFYYSYKYLVNYCGIVNKSIQILKSLWF